MTRINVGLSRDERYEVGLRTRIRRTPTGPCRIVVLGVQGGTGKTALTVTLASVFAHLRRERVLVVDADSGAGLADRAGRQSNTGLDVLSAAQYAAPHRATSARDAASQRYRVVVTDGGRDFADPATRTELSTASEVILVVGMSVDGARQAGVAIDWLNRNGYAHLLTRMVVVVNHVVPAQHSVGGRDLMRRFERRISPAMLVELPWDKHIAAGDAIRLDQLGPAYRRRILELAATLSDEFHKAVPR